MSLSRIATYDCSQNNIESTVDIQINMFVLIKMLLLTDSCGGAFVALSKLAAAPVPVLAAVSHAKARKKRLAARD
jgi:hypothetical protein